MIALKVGLRRDEGRLLMDGRMDKVQVMNYHVQRI